MRPDHLGQKAPSNPIELVDGSWINVLPANVADEASKLEVTWIYGINKNTGIDALVVFGTGPNASSVNDLNLRMVCGVGNGGAEFTLGDAPLELPPNHCLFAKLVKFDESAITTMTLGAGVQLNALGYYTKG